MLTASNIANLDLSGISMMCVSSIDLKTPAHIHFAARRLRAGRSKPGSCLGFGRSMTMRQASN
jgi:hypothetical protein